MLWLIGIIIALALAFTLFRGYFNAEARARRRRTKSHKPVVSRKQGATVRLAVDVNKPKRDRKS